ncbi:hypothetical protein [Variovorax sp. dw_954]|uniref:hypothetical protein n=1 Tax=Variovorax sp. dw_954 TaxID=2720078 RepID=UPI001BD44AC7|nr:hypothetical protein [Variovorax sp. dw_954]
MESLERSKSIIELGKRLAASMAKDEDLTAEWMAHLISERMHAVEMAPPEGKEAAEEACVREILRLWSHRFAAPNNAKPLGDIESVARTLASLDPSNTFNRFNPHAMTLADAENIRNENDWLKLALQLDYAARELIGFALRKGAQHPLASVEFQTTLSEALQGDADVAFELPIVQFILQDDNSSVDSRLKAATEKATMRRIERLERFAQLALDASAGLRATLSG